jgi:hypothetical protein
MLYGSLDFESYYEKKGGYSLSGMGSWEYCFDPRFEPYLVSYTDERGTWLEEPQNFDWELLRGRTIFVHNANFEGVVLLRMVRDGAAPLWIAPKHAEYRLDLPLLDTADLAAWLHVERDLSTACKYLLDVKVDKGPRDMMKGLHWWDPKPGQIELAKSFITDTKELEAYAWKQPTPEQRETFKKYATVDSQMSYQLGMKWLHAWPEHERRLSNWQREAGFRGVYVDQPYLVECIAKLTRVRFEAGTNIPWDWGPGTKLKTPMNLVEARKHCLRIGIPAPASFAKADPDTLLWMEKYAEKVEWIKGLRDWWSSNAYLQKFQTIQRRLRSDGTVPYSNKYFGTHTGRPGSEAGLNMLNLDKNPKFDCDIRRVFRARPGHKLVLMDQSQIEPRCLALLAGNRKFLAMVKSGQDPYEVHARLTMGWAGGDLSEAGKTDKAAKKMRDTSKGRVLAGGYGCGFRKFINMLPRYGIDPDAVFSDPVTIEEETAVRDWLIMAKQAESQKEFDGFCATMNDSSMLPAVEGQVETPRYTQEQREEAAKFRRWWINSWKQIQAYRASNPEIVGLWRQLHSMAELCASRKEDMSVTLPGGRKITYYKPFLRNGEIIAWVVRGDHPGKLYGGLLAENATQTLAREVFSNRQLALLDAGINILWTVYDEYVTEIPDALVAEPGYLAKIKAIASESPSWAPELPVAVTQEVTEFYKK